MKSRTSKRTGEREWPGLILAVGRSRQAGDGREPSRARVGAAAEAEDGSLPARALPFASSRQQQVMTRRNIYHPPRVGYAGRNRSVAADVRDMAGAAGAL